MKKNKEFIVAGIKNLLKRNYRIDQVKKYVESQKEKHDNNI